MVAEERKPHPPVIEGCPSPPPSRPVTLGAIARDGSERVDRHVTVAAGALRAGGDRHRLAAPPMASLATHGCVLSQELEAEAGMVDRRAPERPALRVTAEALARLFRDRVRGSVAIDAGPPRRAATELGFLVALRTRLVRVLPLQDQPGNLGVRSLPLAEGPAAGRLARLVTGVALLE